jgi:hypothetical protein
MIDNTVEKYMSKSVDALKTISLLMFDINIIISLA